MSETASVPDASGRGWKPTLADLVAVAVAGLSYGFAPAADTAGRLAQQLGPYFGSAAQIGATLLVAIALFDRPLGDEGSARAHRHLSARTFVYLGLAIAAALTGTIAAVPDDAARILFAVTSGPGAAGLVTVLLIGRANIGAQREGNLEARALAVYRAADAARCQAADPKPAGEERKQQEA